MKTGLTAPEIWIFVFFIISQGIILEPSFNANEWISIAHSSPALWLLLRMSRKTLNFMQKKRKLSFFFLLFKIAILQYRMDLKTATTKKDTYGYMIRCFRGIFYLKKYQYLLFLKNAFLKPFFHIFSSFQQRSITYDQN